MYFRAIITVGRDMLTKIIRI